MIGRGQTLAWCAVAVSVATAVMAHAPVFGQGCGPTRLKVTESLALDAPPAKVWSVLANFQDVSWDGEAVAAKGSGGNTPDAAVREVRLKDGVTLSESLYKYSAEAMSYSYHIDKLDVARLPVQNASLTLEVVPGTAPDKSVVRWKAAFYRYLKPNEGSPEAADHAAAEAMRDYLKASLSGLKTKITPRS